MSAFHIGGLPVHIYALCIVSGILFALASTDRRWLQRGGAVHQVGDVAGWAVIFGIVGGRIYHVITDPELYFGSGGHFADAFKIWDGGLGIWGAIMLGAVGAYIGCRRHGLNFVAFADAAAPGIVVAQALGRLGNWFNNELYGRPTDLPWGLKIYQMNITTGHVDRDAAGHQIVLGTFQPTFLYELLWNLLIAGLLVWADHRYRLARGQVIALYVMGYTVGRFVIELLRSDTANHILGLRVNTWVAAIVFLGGMILFLRQRGKPRSTAVPAAEENSPPDAAVEKAAPASSSAGAVNQVPENGGSVEG